MIDCGKKEQVKKILLMPIECEKKHKKIILDNNIIKTSQKYYSRADADMSDFTIGFYEILYRELLKNEGILKDKVLKDKNFAGDTMNTFNTVANIILGDRSTANRSPEEIWPEYLKKYSKTYHCLANFWVIPMKHGRGLPAKLNKYDSVELYISRIESCIASNEGYFKKFKSIEEFLTTHCLNLNGIESEMLKEFYQKRESKLGGKVVEQLQKIIKLRAEKIVENENICNALYDYFKDLGLINNKCKKPV